MSLLEDDEVDGSPPKPPESLKGDDGSSKNPSNPKGLLRTNQSQRTISPLMLFKEDFDHFKEDFLSVFKDRDARPAQEDLRTTASPLTLLKDDLIQFKEDFSSVFRIGVSKDRDTKDVAAAKTHHPKTEGSDDAAEPRRNTIAGDQSGFIAKEQRTENIQGAAEMPSEKDAEDDGAGGLAVGAEGTNNNQPGDREEDTPASEEPTEEPQRNQEMLPTSSAEPPLMAAAKCSESEDEWSDTLPALSDQEEMEESLTSEIHLLRPDARDQLGEDRWSVKNLACYLTLDPNTANSELRLSNGNRTATRVWPDCRPGDHPECFQQCPQVLCREGLLDSAYWEVEWSGGADVGVAYNSIGRGGASAGCLLGHSRGSWSLECSEGGYAATHANRRWGSCLPEPFTRRVGVHLDWTAGTLSFYCVSRDAMVHLHTFTCGSFSEPLYPGFWVWAHHGSVSLRQVELDRERLLR